MASFREIVEIIISADGKQAVAEIGKVGAAADKDLKKASTGATHLSSSFLKAGAVMVGAGAAIGFGIASTVKAAESAELAQIKLNTVLKNSPALAGVSAGAFNKQAIALSQVTVASHVAVNELQAMLGQFGMTKTQILELTPAVVDIARKMGIDLPSAAKAVGKAVDGNSAGLRRLGVNLDLTAYKSDHFGAVLQALGVAHGYAIAEGKTFDGQLQILGHNMDRFKESVGRGALSILNDLLPALNSVAGGLGNLDAATGGAIGRFATIGAGSSIAVGGLLLLVGAAMKARAAMAAMAETAPMAASAIGVLGGAALGFAIGAAVDQAVQALLNKLIPGADDARNAVIKFGGDGKKAVSAFKDSVQRDLGPDLFSRDMFSSPGSFLGTFPKALKNLTDSSGAAKDAIVSNFKKIAESSPASAKNLLANLKTEDPTFAARNLGGSWKALDSVLAGVTQKTLAQKAAQDGLTLSDEQAKQANDNLTKALGDWTKEQDTAAAKTQTYVDSVFQAADAQDAWAAASKTLADDMKGTDLTKRAADIRAVATASKEWAIQRLGPDATASEKTKAGYDAEIGSLKALETQYPALRPVIDGYIADLGRANAASQANSTELGIAVASLQALEDKYPQLRSAIDPLISKLHELDAAQGTDANATAISVLEGLKGKYHDLRNEIQKVIDLINGVSKTSPALPSAGPATLPTSKSLVAGSVAVPGLPDAQKNLDHFKDTLIGLPPFRAPVISVPGAPESTAQLGTFDKTLRGLPPGAAPSISAPGADVSTGQVSAFDRQLLGLPPEAHTDVNAPGAPAAKAGTDQFLQSVGAIPPEKHTTISAPGAFESALAIGNVGAALGGIHDATAHVGVAGAAEAVLALGSVGSAIGSIQGSNVHVGVQVSKTVRAEGGPLRKGQGATVGEQGTELWLPKSVQPPAKAAQGAAKASVDARTGKAPAKAPVGVYLLTAGPHPFVAPTDGTVVPHEKVAETAAALGIDPNKIPRRARGGTLRRKETALVGEAGREVYVPLGPGDPLVVGQAGPALFTAPQAGEVFPHAESEQLLRAQGTSVASTRAPLLAGTSTPAVAQNRNASNASKIADATKTVTVAQAALAEAVKQGNTAVIARAEQAVKQSKAALVDARSTTPRPDLPRRAPEEIAALPTKAIPTPTRPVQSPSRVLAMAGVRDTAARSAGTNVEPNVEQLYTDFPDALSQRYGDWRGGNLPHAASSTVASRLASSGLSTPSRETVGTPPLPSITTRDGVARMSVSTPNTTYNITVQAPLSNPVDIGKKVVEVVTAYEKRNGSSWRNR